MREIRISIIHDRKQPKRAVHSPEDAFSLLAKRAARLDREHFWRIDLDARSNVLSLETVSIGTATASLVHPREFLQGAIAVGATALIAAHNHPSQDCEPSAEDLATTRRLVKACRIMGIPLLDHIIIGGSGKGLYVSLKEKKPQLFGGRSWSD